MKPKLQNGKLANAIMFAIYKHDFMAYLLKSKRSHYRYVQQAGSWLIALVCDTQAYRYPADKFPSEPIASPPATSPKLPRHGWVTLIPETQLFTLGFGFSFKVLVFGSSTVIQVALVDNSLPFLHELQVDRAIAQKQFGYQTPVAIRL